MVYTQTNGFREYLAVQKLSKDDEESFKILYDFYHSDILAYSKILIKIDVQAEEIVQDVFKSLA